MQLLEIMIHSRIFFCIYISIIFHSASVHSWGKLGHEIVANIAWSRLAAPTQDWITEILSSDLISFKAMNSSAGSPLANVANWADIVRYTHDYHWSAPLHFIDIRDDEILNGCPIMDPENYGWKNDCHFLYERDCPHDVCVSGAIMNYSSLLLASSKVMSCTKGSMRVRRIQSDISKRAEASPLVSLKFLTHFVGDIHQPLHVSRKTDIGGNKIEVNFDPLLQNHDEILLNELKSTKKSWSLHSVWDDGIIEKTLSELFHGSREGFEKDLIKQLDAYTADGELTLWLICADGRRQDCTTQWAEESLEYALSWAYRNEHGNDIHEGDDISDKYYRTRLPILQRRLVAAGVRLAITLELIHNEVNSDKEIQQFSKKRLGSKQVTLIE
jgi:S1/P1 Nuclease